MTLVEVARKDLGQAERPGQLGFADKKFAAAMADVGYIAGWSWASLVLEKWAREAMPEKAEELNGYFVAHPLATLRNLKNAGYVVTLWPTEGALVFWQRMEEGRAIWQGHAGIVSRVVSGTEFYSIEAWQDELQEMHRHVRKIVHEGLKVAGFVTL